MNDRRDELSWGLSRVRDRITEAARVAGRKPDTVSLIVVTKTFPASDVQLLAELGVRDVGESRHPEARDKVAEVGTWEGLTWHFVGALQTNKAAAVARYVDVVHSVDRARLVDALSRAAERAGRTLHCLVQVSLDPPTAGTARSGAPPEQAPALADRVADATGLRLAGVMAVAPLGLDPAPAYARLLEVSEQLRRSHPDASVVSAGMSGDLESAVTAGATHVRIGRAILGERPPLR